MATGNGRGNLKPDKVPVGGSANIDKIEQPNCHPAATRKSLQHSEKTIPGIEESLKQIR